MVEGPAVNVKYAAQTSVAMGKHNPLAMVNAMVVRLVVAPVASITRRISPVT